MEIVVEDIGKQRKALKIKVKPEDYRSKVEAGLKEKQRNGIFPGFRRGHMPLDLIKKQHGPYLLSEELHKIVPEIMDNYIKENNLYLIAHPIPTKDNYLFGDKWDMDTVFEFDYELGIAPEIDLEQSFEEDISHYVVDVTEEMIDSEVEAMRRRYGEYSKPETTEINDYTFGEFLELDDSGKAKENGIQTKAVFAMALLSNEADRNKFIGLKVGDEVQFDLVNAVKNEAEISHLLNIKRDEIKNLSANFKFTVKEITRKEKPELTQEQFDKWYGVGKINSMDEYRQNIKMAILEKYVHYSNNQLFYDIKNYLLMKLDPHIPIEYLKNMLAYNNEHSSDEGGKMNDEKINEKSLQIANSYKWNYIEVAIIKKFNISVTNEEFGTYAYHHVIEKMQEDKVDMTDQNYEKYSAEFGKDKESIEYLHDAIVHQKIFKALTDFLKIDVITLPIDVFSSKITYQRNR